MLGQTPQRISTQPSTGRWQAREERGGLETKEKGERRHQRHQGGPCDNGPPLQVRGPHPGKRRPTTAKQLPRNQRSRGLLGRNANHYQLLKSTEYVFSSVSTFSPFPGGFSSNGVFVTLLWRRSRRNSIWGLNLSSWPAHGKDLSFEFNLS